MVILPRRKYEQELPLSIIAYTYEIVSLFYIHIRTYYIIIITVHPFCAPKSDLF